MACTVVLSKYADDKLEKDLHILLKVSLPNIVSFEKDLPHTVHKLALKSFSVLIVLIV